jgi:hypothetical protein
MGRQIRIWLCAAALILLCGLAAQAQYSTIGVPFSTAGHSFYEYSGVRWGLRGNGWFFNFGGPALPPFGGFDPNAGASFGFGGRNGFINFSAGQGSSTMFGGQTPFITLPNGGFGTFNDQTLQPFVTGIIPVVGYEPRFDSVLEERLSRLQSGEGIGESRQSESAGPGSNAKGTSSADRGEPSVAEIKARRAAQAAAEDESAKAEIASLLEKAQAALAAGKPGVAKIHLQIAARRAEGQQRAEILQQIDSLPR